MKIGKYFYIAMIIISAIISGIMMYIDAYFFGILMLIITLANVINLIDIINNNKETK